jgi:peptide deformylase
MNETKLEIKKFGDPLLRKKTKRIEQVTQEERDILSKMAQKMYEVAGIGLAANQVGIDKCMAVVDTGEGLYKLINPRIVKKEGIQVSEEGCLSIPSVYIKVKRAKKVEVVALDEWGKPITVKAEGLMAVALQQEIDHLNGKMIIDYASLWERFKIKKALAEIKRGCANEKLS